MSEKTPRPADWPASMLDDDRTWQGDYDPYLGALARQGRRPFHAASRREASDGGAREAAPAQAPDHAGGSDSADQDPYLAGLARKPHDSAAT
ncbi:hypothetical protein [Wenzhouxiangella sp. XN24]|uniref:hypothetical protein n=1 Tax=Wenzhouxiangella sp. XN24 TaxID=2713569 RepID=UPI0013EE332B|nr:hypothetical protein [Wenzhouxiangella sp. XN24]NGX16093.1 hypothetical protein [Wenzhouxiangella sp. XN24]